MKAGLLTTEHIRALAHSYYEQGADGMSVYNWFTARELNLPENFTALEEIGDPTFLARRAHASICLTRCTEACPRQGA